MLLDAGCCLAISCESMTNRLKEVREAQGLSQMALSRASGVSLRQVQYIEAGAIPRVDTANALVDALNVPGKAPVSITDIWKLTPEEVA